MQSDRPAPPATRSDVAARAGVSAAVVSYVVNNGPRPVAATTRERVERAIADLGYRPNSVARALRTRQTHTLGLLVPDIRNPYFAELAAALEDAAHEKGYALLLADTNESPERQIAQLRALRERQVDGVFIVGDHIDSENWADVPVIRLDRRGAEDGMNGVFVDNHAGARVGTAHLIGHGHREIICISGPRTMDASAQRVEGWMAAMEAAGLPTAGRVIEAPFTRAGGYAAAQHMFEEHPAATAAFVCSDLQGIGVLSASYQRSRRVPDELAVITFDGTAEAEFAIPPLTVVSQPVSTMADAAVAMMLGGTGNPAAAHLLKAELVIRRSCGCG